MIKKQSLNKKPLKIKRALISVYDKTGIIELVKGLTDLNIEILSTGGTATLIRETTNKIIPILNSDVKKIEKSPVSLMPPGLTLSLRSDELVDLISFLVSLNGNN